MFNLHYLLRKLRRSYNRFSPWILPYNVYRKKENKGEFLKGNLSYSEKPWIAEEEKHPFKTVVSVQGFGYSGSGAVLDLLCESNACEVIGTNINNETALDHIGLESDFLRLAGGIFELEKYIGSNNVFHNDAMIKRFIRYAESFPLFIQDQTVKNLFYSFFDDVIGLKISGLKHPAYNPHIAEESETYNILFFKPLSLNQFQEYARSFLNRLFNYLNKSGKEILVFDQLLCDFEFDMERYKHYLPGCKLITVYRDPRDVYAFAHEKNIGWIAHDSVSNFIQWYGIMTANLNLKSTEYLVVRFEELINNYDQEITRIFEYLDLPAGHHSASMKRKFFNPDISRRGVGIWKTSMISRSDYEQIHESLAKYCYNDD